MKKNIFTLSRYTKQIIMVLTDICTISGCYYASYSLRLNSWSAPWLRGPVDFCMVLSCLLLVTLGLCYFTGQYRMIVHYMSTKDINIMLLTIVFSGMSIYIFSALFAVHVPRTVPVIYMAFMTILYGGARLTIRNLYLFSNRTKVSPNVIIYGAGLAGTELVAALQLNNIYCPVAFIDDDPAKQGIIQHGIHIHPFEDLATIIRHYDVEKILLAMPRLHRSERKMLLDKLKPYHLEIMTVPSLVDNITEGHNAPGTLEEVQVEDILGRDTVPPHEDLLFRTTRDKVVMVTGAGGSIGSELCRQIATHRPKRLVLFEHSEIALYTIDQELRKLVTDVEILPCLGDVKNRADVEEKMRAFGVQTVYHAAAYKHVPMVELNVIAGVRNNIFGTLHTAQAAMAAGVEHFVLISTDKAVRPTNIMGTTKRVAELILQAYAASQQGTRFCMVRFGNVLGSSGSVFPLFRKQIAAGGPVTVTHEAVTRFFMTIPEAVQLVLQASGMANGGDVFVLDMGAPVKIIDMAKEMIRLSGKSLKDADHPNGDIEIRVTGLRPGEKLYEELLVADGALPTSHPRIMTQKEQSLQLDYLLDKLQELDDVCTRRDVGRITTLLQNSSTGYRPRSNISDLVWISRRQSLV